MPLKQSTSQFSQVNTSSSDEEINLRELFYVIFNQKWKIVIVTIFFSLIGVFYSLFLMPEHHANYEVSAKILNDNKNSIINKVLFVSSWDNQGEMSYSTDSEIAYIRNDPKFIRLVVEKANLKQYLAKKNSESEEGNYFRTWLNENLTIETDGGPSGLIVFKMITQDVSYAKNLVNTYVDLYYQAVIEYKLNQVKDVLNLLDKRNLYSEEELREKISSEVRIILLASEKELKPKSKKNLTIIVFSVFGLFFSIFIVFIMRFIEDKEWIKRELEKLSLPIFATFQKKDISPDDLSYKNAVSFFHANLQYKLSEKNSNIVMISEIDEKANQSLLITDIAIAEAEMGKKVLLIDANMQMQKASEALPDGDSKKVCLKNILGIEEHLYDILHKSQTDVVGFDFIPTGLYPGHSVEVLTSQNFPKLLNRLSNEYDLILIMAPAVKKYADACIIGKYTGMNILVARENIAVVSGVRGSVERFNQAGVFIDGVILNNVNPA